jgi:hypothetical protein
VAQNVKHAAHKEPQDAARASDAKEELKHALQAHRHGSHGYCAGFFFRSLRRAARGSVIVSRTAFGPRFASAPFEG